MGKQAYKAFLAEKAKIRLEMGFEPKEEMNPMLYDFQRDAVLWALRRGRAAIFFDCGLGKTPIQLEFARHINIYTQKPVLIFAPLAVSNQTVREGDKFGVKVNICKSASGVADGINITNYERIEKFDLSVFSGIVLDESSILRSFSGKFRNEIISKTESIRFKLACTATPVPNDYMELGNHSEFLGVMSRSEMLACYFTHDSGNTSQWRLKGHAKNVYWKWLASWGLMMRNPADLGYDGKAFILPDLRIHEHVVKTDKAQDGMLFPVEAMTLDEQRKAKRATIPERVEELAEIINGSGDQWLVWCDLNDESHALTQALDGAVEVKGSDSNDHKESSMLEFSNGNIPVLVTKPSIAGHGMNWQNCHNMAFVGLSHSWEAFYQATRRCWRYGQTEPVDAHIIISDMEMRIVRNIRRKEAQFKEMYDGLLRASNEYMRDEIHSIAVHDRDYETDVVSTQDWMMIYGDSIEEIKKLDTESIHFSIFSPPFSSLYTYSDSNRDMGNSSDDSEFQKHYEYLCPELLRVLKPGRCIAIHCSDIPAMKERDGYIGLKDFPAVIREAMEAAGFIYFSRITIWKDPVVEVTRTKALGLLHKQLKKDSCRCRVGLPDYILVFQKPGENIEPVEHDDVNYPVPRWQEIASPVWMNIKQGNVLKSQKDAKDERHICPLQLDVIERLLELYTNPGDLVLSPFAGIGSEGYQALLMGRRFIGIELKRSYFEQALDNLSDAMKKRKQDFLL